jgi:hypothetical protein
MSHARIKPLSLALMLGLLANSAHAAEPTTVNAGKWNLDLRMRWEHVDDAKFVPVADAYTLRTRLGYRTRAWKGFSATIEALNTTHLAGDWFNSTTNGRSNYPVVADPDNTSLHQAYVNFAPNDHARATAGRQRLNYDNQRFIGAVGWRQNEQTFDAVDLQYGFGKGPTIRYSYANRVQRVFEGYGQQIDQARWMLSANFLNISQKLGPGTLTGYAYFIENETLPLTSHQDFGIRYAAKKESPDGLGWMATLEGAHQSSYAHGSSLIDADYLMVEAGAIWRGNTFKAGWEQLGGDGKYGFQTPLATLHAFNGWADRFLATPANGLQDSYLAWSRKFGKLTANVIWHDFRADQGSTRYGSEWDASVAYAWSPHFSALLKLADFQAGDVGYDVNKTWIGFEYSY